MATGVRQPDYEKYGIDSKEQRYRGMDVFAARYFNIAILSKKHSGKTTLIWEIIRRSLQKNTIVLFFTSTWHKDKTYRLMRKALDEKNIQYEGFTHFIDDDGHNLVEEFMSENIDDDDDEPDDTPALYSKSEALAYGMFGLKKRKSRKKKTKPEYIIVFDDLSRDIRHKSIEKLIKKNRHYRAKIIMSSQAIVDITPGMFVNLEYLIIFKSFSDDTLLNLYKRSHMWIPYEDFLSFYKDAVSEPYGFLLVDMVGNNDQNKLKGRIIGQHLRFGLLQIYDSSESDAGKKVSA